MSRLLKFRAWITRYDDPYMLILKPFKNWYDVEDGFLLGFANGSYAGIGSHECYEEDTEDVDFQIMEFTGILDKNSKEIYEGDIVKNTNPESEAFGELAEVGYHQGIGGFTVVFESIGQYKMLGLYENLEVVGNIYENPKLLK